MIRSDSYEEETSRWKGWAFVLLVIAACILLLKLLG
jgi:hypothetical protein